MWEVVSLHPLSGVDITPNNFTLGDISGSKLSQLHFSENISVSGINTASVISISNGEYSINSGEFTKDKGVVRNHDTVTVRLLSSDSYSTEIGATLTIGGASDTFKVTTGYPIEYKKSQLKHDPSCHYDDIGNQVTKACYIKCPKYV